MYKLQVKVLEQELEKLGGKVPESQDLMELAKLEQIKEEALLEAKEEAALAKIEEEESKLQIEDGAWNFDEEDNESLLIGAPETQISKELL